MTWTKFEQDLNTAFATYVKSEKKEVFSNQMKFSYLQDKIKCDTLLSVSSALKVAMSSYPNFTYNEAMKVYRVAVMKAKTGKGSRQVQEQNRGRE